MIPGNFRHIFKAFSLIEVAISLMTARKKRNLMSLRLQPALGRCRSTHYTPSTIDSTLGRCRSTHYTPSTLDSTLGRCRSTHFTHSTIDSTLGTCRSTHYTPSNLDSTLGTCRSTHYAHSTIDPTRPTHRTSNTIQVRQLLLNMQTAGAICRAHWCLWWFYAYYKRHVILYLMRDDVRWQGMNSHILWDNSVRSLAFRHIP